MCSLHAEFPLPKEHVNQIPDFVKTCFPIFYQTPFPTVFPTFISTFIPTLPQLFPSFSPTFPQAFWIINNMNIEYSSKLHWPHNASYISFNCPALNYRLKGETTCLVWSCLRQDCGCGYREKHACKEDLTVDWRHKFGSSCENITLTRSKSPSSAPQCLAPKCLAAAADSAAMGSQGWWKIASFSRHLLLEQIR